MAAAGTQRVSDIDGIRGWAALSVMGFHFFHIFIYFDPRFDNFALRTLLNGDLDVAVFFVLSGEALSANYWRTGTHAGTIRLALKRYSRLSLPILAASLAMFGLIAAGLVFNLAAGEVLQDRQLAGHFHYPYTLMAVVSYALSDVYFRYGETSSLIPPLWTMRTEMLGSLLVFLFVWVERGVPRKTLLLLALAIVLTMSRTYLGCFMFGVLFGQWRAEGVFARLRAGEAAAGFIPAAVALLVLAGLPPEGSPVRDFVLVPLSAALVFCVYANPVLSGMFSGRLSQWLGHISFPLYLVHVPVLTSLSCWMVVQAAGRGMLTGVSIGLIIAVSMAVSLAAAVAFAPVEVLTRRAGERVCEAFGVD